MSLKEERNNAKRGNMVLEHVRIFLPKGRTYSPLGNCCRSFRAVVSLLRRARALCEADTASADASGQCRGRFANRLPSLSAQRISARRRYPLPAQTCRRQICRSYGHSVILERPFSFPKRNKRGVRADGDLSSGSKDRKSRNRTLCLRCGGIFELFADQKRI